MVYNSEAVNCELVTLLWQQRTNCRFDTIDIENYKIIMFEKQEPATIGHFCLKE